MPIYGIDANVLTRPRITGTERYVKHLLTEMMQEPLKPDERVILYTSKPIKLLPELPENWSEKILKWPLPKGWTHGRLSIELQNNSPDVFFSPAHEIPLLTGRTKILSTVHDVAFRKYPEIYSTRAKKRQEWAVNRVKQKADRIMTISNTSKQDLVELYQIPASKIHLAHLAVYPADFKTTSGEVERVAQKYQLPQKKYFVTVGRVEKKKNIPLLLKAFQQVPGEVELVLAGGFGAGEEEIKQLISQDSRIKALGYLPDEDLAGLLGGALGYVFPSRYEGFGIPILEAFSAGIPVIASDIPALREVGGEAAKFVGVNNQTGWTVAMRELLQNEQLRDHLVSLGQERLGHFSWSQTAQKTWQVLRGL